MPRSLRNPTLGQMMWYSATTPPTGYSAAIVIGKVDDKHFNLAVVDATGVWTVVNGCLFYDGATRPTSGAWFTWPRIQDPPASGVWPSEASEAVGAMAQAQGQEVAA